MKNSEGSFSNNRMWKLKMKICGRGPERLTIKKDKEGNIVTDPKKIKQLYSDVFTEPGFPKGF